MFRWLYPFLLAAAVFVTLWAVEEFEPVYGRVHGVVIDEFGAPLADRVVHITPADKPKKSLMYEVSRREGRYYFEELEPGDYLIGVEANDHDQRIQGPDGDWLLGTIVTVVDPGSDVRQDIRAVPLMPFSAVVEPVSLPAFPDAPEGWQIAAMSTAGEIVADGRAEENGYCELKTTHRGEVWLAGFLRGPKEGKQTWEVHARAKRPLKLDIDARGLVEPGNTQLMVLGPMLLATEMNLSWVMYPAEQRSWDFWWERFRQRKRAAGGSVKVNHTHIVHGLIPGPYRIGVFIGRTSIEETVEVPETGIASFRLDGLCLQLLERYEQEQQQAESQD